MPSWSDDEGRRFDEMKMREEAALSVRHEVLARMYAMTEMDYRAALQREAKLAKRLSDMEYEREAACENTPRRDCECPGCCTARERADGGGKRT